MSYLIIILLLAPLIWRLFTHYKQGISWAVFLLTALSAYPVLISGGNLPNFNIQRLILLILLVATLTKRSDPAEKRTVPYRGLVILYAAVNLLPLIFSIDIIMSVKAYLALTIEIVLFYYIISASIDTAQEARRIVFAGALALITVGLLAIVERYSGFNPVDAFMPGYVRKPEYENDTLATFPHRILLGTAMAMGWSLALAFAQAPEKRRWLWWAGICVLLIACYFSFSRGPWIGALFGGVIMFLFAGKAVRRQTMIVMVLIALALVLRPGVWDTLTTSAHETADVNSFKGQTYQYRWELWGIAWNKISRSSTRLLFGFGQGSTEVLTFDAVLSYTGETTKLWSWDNHYAATLMENGLVGLMAFIGLHLFFLLKLFSVRRTLAKEDLALHASILSSITTMLFMMTNVLIFAPQLNYLIWALIAAGLRLGAGERQQKGLYAGTSIV